MESRRAFSFAPSFDCDKQPRRCIHLGAHMCGRAVGTHHTVYRFEFDTADHVGDCSAVACYFGAYDSTLCHISGRDSPSCDDGRLCHLSDQYPFLPPPESAFQSFARREDWPVQSTRILCSG